MPDDCLFCRMASGALDVPKVYEDERLFVIRDINPRAPIHDLVIPRKHIPTAEDVSAEDGPLLAYMLQTATRVAEIEHVAERGYRLAFNVRGDSGMTIWHLHLHLVGGRKLGPEG
ncbi:MAG TPA: HIT domain-containing protein [Dehalococcoidia bacterium]|nr:HIT domain-containing protein [Dehalococcoidia bacterium]